MHADVKQDEYQVRGPYGATRRVNDLVLQRPIFFYQLAQRARNAEQFGPRARARLRVLRRVVPENWLESLIHGVVCCCLHRPDRRIGPSVSF